MKISGFATYYRSAYYNLGDASQKISASNCLASTQVYVTPHTALKTIIFHSYEAQ